MNKKWQNIFLKGLSAVLLSLLSLIFIGISSANAWEMCGDGGYAGNNEAFGIDLSGQFVADVSEPIYFYNKCHTDWSVSNGLGLTFWNGDNVYVGYLSCGGGVTLQDDELPYFLTIPANSWANDITGGIAVASGNASLCGNWTEGAWQYNGVTDPSSCYCFSDVKPGGTQPEPPTPPALEEPYILYYGNSPYYASINATATFPVVYNICQDWDETKTYQLLLTETASSSPIIEGASLELDQCSGSKNIEFNTGEDEDFYISNIKIREIETQTTIVETDNIYFAIVSTIETSGNMIEFITESPLYINRTGYGTTTVLTFVQMLSEEIATDNEICLITENGEKSENCINAEIGIAYKEITIDIPQYDTTQIIKLGLYDENDNLLMTSNSPVMLVIYASFYDPDTWNNQFSSTSASSLMGLNSSQLACSIAEWQDTSWWQTLKCSGKKFVFDIMFILEKLVRSFFGTIMNGMENIFPFSIIANVNQSWTRSATKNLPPDITWIAPEGDLIFTVPANWTGQGTTTEVIAFGDSIFKTGDNSIAIFFERIRALSKYLIMAGLVWSFVQFGTYFYWTHLAEEQKE